MEKISIPEKNSLDSFEGIEPVNIEQKNLEPSKEQITEFILQSKRYEGQDDFEVNTQIAEAFYNIGHPELARRSAFAYFRKQLELHIQENRGVSHTMNKAYSELVYGARIHNELTNKLGEMLGKLYESSGRFKTAYEYYRESCPDKYADKLGSVAMSSEDITDILDKREWWRFQIPSDSGVDPVDGTHPDFPDFKKLPNRDEVVKNEQKLFEDFLKVIPREIMQIDTKSEFKSLMTEAKKIAEKFEKKT